MPAPLPHDAFARAVRAAFGAAARVVGEEPLAGDASTRRYVRLRLAGADCPQTAVVMILPPDARSPELGGSSGAESELPFVNVGRYFGTHGLPVPTLYHDGAARDGLLLLEDIGDTTLFAAASAAPGEAGALFEQAVDLVVELQALGARGPDPGCYAFGRRFDFAMAYAEVEHFVEHGIETRQGRVLPAGERARLLAALEPVCEPFATAEPVLSHRDYMAWNLHVQEGRRVRMIDFQDALLAPDAFDLSQLLTDRTTITVVPPALEDALVARFLAGRAAKGLPVEGDFMRRYRLGALQHALKVIGRFHFLDRVRGKPGYLAYLPSVYVVARRMLAVLPEVADAVPLVAAYVPELRPEAS